MKHYSVFVFTLCLLSAFAEDKNVIPQGVSEAILLFNECWTSEGISPCLKMKALSLIDRVSRMEKITLIDGLEFKGTPNEKSKEPSLEEEEQNLPRAIDAKDQALTSMIFRRIARAIGSKTIEISLPKIIETARKGSGGGDDFTEKFGDFGGGQGGGGGKGKGKKGKKDKSQFMEFFLAGLLAKKIAMIPLYIGALFMLALKALITSKAALLIIGSVAIKKLLSSRQQQGPAPAPAVHHVSAGPSGWDGAGGWGRRSYETAQNMAFQGQKPT